MSKTSTAIFYTLIFCLGVGICGLGFLIFGPQPRPEAQLISPQRYENSQKLKERIFAGTQKPLPDKQAIAKIKSDTESASPECQSFWTQLDGYPFQNTPDSEVVPFPSGKNCDHPPNFFKTIHDRFTSECETITSKNKTDCITLALMYRGSLRDYQTRDQEIDRMTDESLLLDKLLGALGTMDPNRIEKVAHRLHDLEPDFYEPIKALVISKLLQSFQVTDDTQKATLLSEFERSLNDAKDFGVEDPELIQAEFFLATKGYQDLDRLKEKSEELIHDYPTHGFGYYALAGYYFKHQDAERTRAALEKAIALEPTQETFSDTLEKFNRNPENFTDKIFTAKMGISMDFDSGHSLKLKQSEGL